MTKYRQSNIPHITSVDTGNINMLARKPGKHRRDWGWGGEPTVEAVEATLPHPTPALTCFLSLELPHQTGPEMSVESLWHTGPQ